MSVPIDVIEQWFDRGVDEGNRWMVIICDTFDWSDYPSYFTEEQTEECLKRISESAKGDNMQKLMEVYDLSFDKAAQFAVGTRVMNGPTND